HKRQPQPLARPTAERRARHRARRGLGSLLRAADVRRGLLGRPRSPLRAAQRPGLAGLPGDHRRRAVEWADGLRRGGPDADHGGFAGSRGSGRRGQAIHVHARLPALVPVWQAPAAGAAGAPPSRRGSRLPAPAVPRHPAFRLGGPRRDVGPPLLINLLPPWRGRGGDRTGWRREHRPVSSEGEGTPRPYRSMSVLLDTAAPAALISVSARSPSP